MIKNPLVRKENWKKKLPNYVPSRQLCKSDLENQVLPSGPPFGLLKSLNLNHYQLVNETGFTALVWTYWSRRHEQWGVENYSIIISLSYCWPIVLEIGGVFGSLAVVVPEFLVRRVRHKLLIIAASTTLKCCYSVAMAACGTCCLALFG